MTEQASNALLEPPEWAVLTRAAAAYRDNIEPDMNVSTALGDPDVVRELLRLLAEHPALRMLIRNDGGPEHPLTSASDTEAQEASRQALAQMRARASQARRGKRAQRRGTGDERRQQRLQNDLSKARQERTVALEQTRAQLATIATLRSAVNELDEALAAETRAVELTAAQRDAARDALTDPRRLATYLAEHLTTDGDILTQATTALGLTTQDATTFHHVLAELANPIAATARKAQLALTVEMLGGGTEVGGSCVLVTAAGARLLVDCGTRPNAPTPAQAAPPRLAEALTGPIDAIIITHAHADHAGWVPAVLSQHPTIPIYTTPATADLLPVMWADAARVYSRNQNSDGPAPYTEADTRLAVRMLRPTPFNRPSQVGALSLSLFPAGHILGAAGVLLTDGTHTAVITGDVSGPGQRTVGSYQLPPDAKGADLLVMESTYGAARSLPSRDRVVAQFIKDISVVVSAGGRVLVPAFALGRAQEIAVLIAEHLPTVPVRIDGLARDITDVYERHHDGDGRPLTILTDNVHVVPRGRPSAHMATFTSGVIVTTSGMLAGGPAVSWARTILPDPAGALMLVGYQDPHSPGSRLEKLAETRGTFTLPNRDGTMGEVEVNAKVTSYGLGAHATPDELVELATAVRAKATMLVHGDNDAREALNARLAARHLHTVPADAPWKAQPSG